MIFVTDLGPTRSDTKSWTIDTCAKMTKSFESKSQGAEAMAGSIPTSQPQPSKLYIYTDMNIVHDMTKANKCNEKQCTIQTVDWWNQATKLWSHMKSVWALQAIKSQLRRWWPCKIYWAMVPRQSFHEQFSKIHVVSRDTVETMTTSIMEEMPIMQSLHLSKNAGALPFTKSLP